MNKHDRKALAIADNIIREQVHVIQSIGEGEQEKFENLPDSLQMSDRGVTFEQNGEALTEMAEQIEQALDDLSLE